MKAPAKIQTKQNKSNWNTFGEGEEKRMEKENIDGFFSAAFLSIKKVNIKEFMGKWEFLFDVCAHTQWERKIERERHFTQR